MPKYLALTTSAGKHNFQSGDQLDMAAKDAKELVDAGAIQKLDGKPKAEPPKSELNIESNPVSNGPERTSSDESKRADSGTES